MSGAFRRYTTDAPTAVDVDTSLLGTKPLQKAMRYMKIKEFGNHVRVDD